MRESVEMLSPETPSFALSTYYSWFDGELSRILAKSNNGLADILYKELIKSLNK
jgi:Rod binding domain-containing protein